MAPFILGAIVFATCATALPPVVKIGKFSIFKISPPKILKFKKKKNSKKNVRAKSIFSNGSKPAKRDAKTPYFFRPSSAGNVLIFYARRTGSESVNLAENPAYLNYNFFSGRSAI